MVVGTRRWFPRSQKIIFKKCVWDKKFFKYLFKEKLFGIFEFLSIPFSDYKTSVDIVQS